MVLFGLLNIYASEYNEEFTSIFSFSQNYGKQFFWIISSFILIIFILMIDAKFYLSFAYIIYGISLLLLIAVLLFGKEIGGSKSWFQIGAVNLQPSEFAKTGVSLALAAYLSGTQVKIHQFKTQLRSFLIFGVPAALIFLQHDLGSAIVFASFVLVLYREGMSGIIILLAVTAAILFILTLLFGKISVIIGIAALVGLIILILLLFYKISFRNILITLIIGAFTAGFVYSVDYGFNRFLQDHQKKRINVLLGKEADPQGAEYNIRQSKIAIGSGGLVGKGFLNGTQTKFDFVPEQSTDFIFCTVGEEWGFIGSTIVIGLFLAFFFRLITLAERQRSLFSRIYGYCVLVIIFFHFMVNMGMTIGLFPVIGIPLPFFSYGGSSLWSFTILLFIFIKQDANRYNIL